MPRIYTSESNPLDFCKECFPLTEDEAFELYGHLGDGPDGRGNCFGYDAEHPDYLEEVEYNCEDCNKRLHDDDN